MTKKQQVMFNAGYGCFGFSEAALRVYRERGGAEGPIARDDALMVSVVKDIGLGAANAPGASIAFFGIGGAIVPFQYTITERDGLESVVVDYETYRFDTARAIMDDDSIPKTTRMDRVRSLLG